MDDGKCLLDVISDPQALKEFFRSTSQIAFVDGDVSPSKERNANRPQPNQSSAQNVIRNDAGKYAPSSQAATTIQSPKPNPVAGNLLQPQQTKPLAHFSYTTSSGLNLQPSTLTSYVNSTLKNGLPVNVTSNLTHVSQSGKNGLGGSTLDVSTQNHVSSIQNMSNLSNSKESVNITRTSISNTPISFAFGDASKARNLLSSGSPVISENLVTTSKQAVNQQLLPGHAIHLKPSPSKLGSNVVTGVGVNSQNRTPIVKASPLPPLRPKKIVPRPVTQQNVSSVPSDQPVNQVGIQGNMLAQAVKGKAATPVKGQPLIAIQPKLIITAQPNVGSGTNLPNQTTLNVGQPSQSIGGNFAVGSKVQTPLAALNTLTVQQQKTGIQSGSLTTQGKVALTNLSQLQPKQIAPKPEQSVGYQATSKGNTTQGQAQLQQQLVQALLAQTQQNQSQQIGLQTSAGTVLNDDKLSKSAEKSQQNLLQQQNQLKELLQRKQVVQHVLQSQRIKQPQNTSPGTSVPVQVGSSNQLGTKPVQTSPLQSLINSSLGAGQTEAKLQQPVGQPALAQLGNSAATTLNLANQMKNAINAKQLQQFLEKNPVLAQQLKQLNLSKGNVVGNTTTSTTTARSLVKNIVQLPNPAVRPAVSVVGQASAVTAPKKMAVSVSGTQQQQAPTLVINQTQRTDHKPLAPQKVLIVQQSSAVGATTPATAVNQPRVLLQTKEGRPILLTQEQFKQIQQQLASKNLSIQGKLVTATTAKPPQVVVKTSEPPTTKAKVVTTSTPKPAVQVKQEVTKGVKRPIKAAESEETKMIKRVKNAILKDQNAVSLLDIHEPFRSHEDATRRLLPFHVYSEPDPNALMQKKANMLLDKLALQLTNKSDRMINKYRQLLLGDMQRDVPSAEVVMVNRIFLADEKLDLMKKKKTALEEARNAAQVSKKNDLDETSSLSLGVNSPASNASNLEPTKDDLSLRLFSGSAMIEDEELDSPMNPSDSQSIDIVDDSPSPMSSATSFLSHVSTNNKELSSIERTSTNTPDPT